MSTVLKGLVAAIAAATAAFAFAQGTPPNAAVTDPAQGAGQRSSQNTPMGTTGTPGGSARAGSAMVGAGEVTHVSKKHHRKHRHHHHARRHHG